MNTTSSATLAFPSILVAGEAQEADGLVLVEDLSYEFVGGGMAANGL